MTRSITALFGILTAISHIEGSFMMMSGRVGHRLVTVKKVDFRPVQGVGDLKGEPCDGKERRSYLQYIGPVQILLRTDLGNQNESWEKRWMAGTNGEIGHKSLGAQANFLYMQLSLDDDKIDAYFCFALLSF
ncbi:hypothetical protein AXG93_3856s1150 [Marchantia polymorpha subsp. ruderalis]|uniref:Uncharacterized protein n=1 Tax=Marchantia polymorpha subsp. ruderalis TaxID=1480154 RepID=A0A176VYM5_MARPO|nr:hypothetical protein AXG93_3856s1150 [Marchantia polymorpha subsp. ruderalis]